MDLKEYLKPTNLIGCTKNDNDEMLTYLYQKLKKQNKVNYLYKYSDQVIEALDDEIDPITESHLNDIFKLFKFDTNAINMTTLILEEAGVTINAASYLYTNNIEDYMEEIASGSYNDEEEYNKASKELEILIEDGFITIIDCEDETLKEYLVKGYTKSNTPFKILSPFSVAVKEYMPRGSECFIEVIGDTTDYARESWMECGGYPQYDYFTTKDNKEIEYWTFAEYEDQQDYFSAADFLHCAINNEIIDYDVDDIINEETFMFKDNINVFFNSLLLSKTKEMLF